MQKVIFYGVCGRAVVSCCCDFLFISVF